MSIDLDEIQRRLPDIPESAMSRAERDRAFLLAYARDLEARIGRVEAACNRVINNEDGHKPPGPPHPTQQQATAVRIRASLTATDAS